MNSFGAASTSPSSNHDEKGFAMPLVGVVVRALAGLPGRPLVGSMAPLDSGQTHFVLVPGSTWGMGLRGSHASRESLRVAGRR